MIEHVTLLVTRLELIPDEFNRKYLTRMDRASLRTHACLAWLNEESQIEASFDEEKLSKGEPFNLIIVKKVL